MERTDVKVGPLPVEARTPGYKVAVGWKMGSYWFAVVDVRGDFVDGQGANGELPELADLLEWSWGYAEWRTPAGKAVIEELVTGVLAQRRPEVQELLRYRAA